LSRPVNISIYEIEKQIAIELEQQDFHICALQVSEILQRLKDGICILEKLGRNPDPASFKQKKAL
jgi:hypothetical protein